MQYLSRFLYIKIRLTIRIIAIINIKIIYVDKIIRFYYLIMVNFIINYEK